MNIYGHYMSRIAMFVGLICVVQSCGGENLSPAENQAKAVLGACTNIEATLQTCGKDPSIQTYASLDLCVEKANGDDEKCHMATLGLGDCFSTKSCDGPNISVMDDCRSEFNAWSESCSDVTGFYIE